MFCLLDASRAGRLPMDFSDAMIRRRRFRILPQPTTLSRAMEKWWPRDSNL